MLTGCWKDRDGTGSFVVLILEYDIIPIAFIYRVVPPPPTWPDRATLEGSSCTDIMTCTGGCGYSF